MHYSIQSKQEQQRCWDGEWARGWGGGENAVERKGSFKIKSDNNVCMLNSLCFLQCVCENVSPHPTPTTCTFLRGSCFMYIINYHSFIDSLGHARVTQSISMSIQMLVPQTNQMLVNISIAILLVLLQFHRATE